MLIWFLIFTFFGYLSIDFAVYWLGNEELVSFKDVLNHHFKMLPVYFFANIALTMGFVWGSSKHDPLMLFGLSILIWIVSLMIVSSILYKVYPTMSSLVGFLFILVGVYFVNLNNS